MRKKFRDVRLSRQNLLRLDLINEIIREYQTQGYVLTLRQLYYQLVSRDIIPNKQAEYSKLSTLLKEGRMGGIVDWSAIEDRLRKPDSPGSWENPKEIIKQAAKQFQMPRMKGQPTYLEVWVEKDALSGVLKKITEKFHIPIMVNRGYSSASAMYDAYKRFVNEGAYQQRPIKILYLGDHDPSGLDMIRDIEERIWEFQNGDDDGEWVDQMEFEVEPIALTKSQIGMYEPPPNPAKVTDPRAGDYIHEHGNVSWEVDALRPEILNEILENAIVDEIDEEMYEEMVSKEDEAKKKIKTLTKYL